MSEERDQEIREQALKSALDEAFGKYVSWRDYLIMAMVTGVAISLGVMALLQ